MPTELFTSKATYPNNIVIPPVALRHPAYYNSQASTHRADYTMSGQAASASPSGTEVNTAADLAKLRADGKPLTCQEQKELNSRIKAFEEMAQMEDRLRALENRKRSHDSGPAEPPTRATSSPREPSTSHQQEHYSSVFTGTESDDSDTTLIHRRKRQRYSRGIKVTPSYTLKVSSSLREWGDWKKDIERVFEGDPSTYRTGSQKILKALDYVDSSLKSLWYTYSD
jgi:hypothetical protein